MMDIVNVESSRIWLLHLNRFVSYSLKLNVFASSYSQTSGDLNTSIDYLHSVGHSDSAEPVYVCMYCSYIHVYPVRFGE